MIFKYMLLTILAVFLATPGSATSQSDVAGIVPRLLTASGDIDGRSAECTLGDAVADAVRNSLGTDFAIVCGGDLIHNLLPGEITYDELSAAFKEDRQLAVVSVTPKELRIIIEAGLSHVMVDARERVDSAASAYDGFPQISGFTLRYDVTSLPGERVRELKVNGEKINLEDDTTTYRLAATGFMLGGGYGLAVVDGATSSELTLSSAMALYLTQPMPDYSQTGRRIYPMGAQNGSLSAFYPMGISLVAIFLIVVGNGRRFKRIYDFKR